MATVYTSATFSKDVVPNGLPREAVDLCHGAVAVGWKAQVKRMQVTLIAPDGHHTITLSASNRNIPYQRHKATIAKYASPLLIGGNSSDEAVEALVATSRTAERIASDKRAVREAADHREIEQAKKVSDPETPATLIAEDEEGHPDAPSFGRHVVSESPMMAHRSQGIGYLSPTTNERRWSDGTVDYTCRSEGCDFDSKERLSVGRHWRKHVRAGEEEAADEPRLSIKTEPHEPVYTRTGYTPRQERVDALAEVLAALDLSSMDATELAEFVLNWQHERSEAGDRLASEREPLTEGDILNRIRALLDNGTYLAQQERIATLEQNVQSLVQDVTVAQSEARRARETLATFRELVAEVDA